MSRKTGLLLIVAAAGLVAALFVALQGWLRLEGVTMTVHGWIALTLGVVLSLLLGGGLMALAFYSSRKGYDDKIEPDGPK
jgi:hypothetical protein